MINEQEYRDAIVEAGKWHAYFLEVTEMNHTLSAGIQELQEQRERYQQSSARVFDRYGQIGTEMDNRIKELEAVLNEIRTAVINGDYGETSWEVKLIDRVLPRD